MWKKLRKTHIAHPSDHFSPLLGNERPVLFGGLHLQVVNQNLAHPFSFFQNLIPLLFCVIFKFEILVK